MYLVIFWQSVFLYIFICVCFVNHTALFPEHFHCSLLVCLNVMYSFKYPQICLSVSRWQQLFCSSHHYWRSHHWHAANCGCHCTGTWLPACLPDCLSACLAACVAVCLPSLLPTYLPLKSPHIYRFLEFLFLSPLSSFTQTPNYFLSLGIIWADF